MKSDINLMIDDFYKTFHKIEELTLKQDIRCLTVSEIHLIKILSNNNYFMSELAKELNVTMGTATVSVNKLVNKGFVIRTSSQEDRRKISVKLSPKGLLALKSHKDFHEIIIEKITKNLSSEEFEKFNKIFKTIGKALVNELNDTNPKSVNEYELGSTVKIIGLSGSRGINEFFLNNSIMLGVSLKIVDKNDKNIFLKINDKEIEMDLEDSKNILGIEER